MTCQNLERLQNSLGATLPCVPSSSPAAWRWTDLLKDTQLARGWARARTVLSSPGPFLLDPLGSCYHIQNERRCAGKYYPLNGTANSDFYAHFGVSGCHHGGNFKSMEKNEDNARWALGIRLFHPPWQEALNFLILWSLFFCTTSEGEVRAQLCCGRLARLNALVWLVWIFFFLKFVMHDFWGHFARWLICFPVKTLSDNYVYKSIFTLLSKIRMNYFFSSHHSPEFQKKTLDYLTLFQPSCFF